MEPITAQMPDMTFYVMCIVAIILVAHFLADVYFSDDWVADRALKRLRRKINRQRKENGTDKWSTQL